MYAVYDRYSQDQKIKLKFARKISLAGCNFGIIPAMLKEKLDFSDNPPLGWELSIAEDYHKNNQSIIIDIKPNNAEEIVLCELDRVFGFSHFGWSPIMLRLVQFYNDYATDVEINKHDFICPEEDQHEIVYTMSYLAGSFKDGELEGKWIFPGRSSTNALLLWPDAMTFFYEQVERYDPSFLNKKTNFIKIQNRMSG
jgi:hypothetical protein